MRIEDTGCIGMTRLDSLSIALTDRFSRQRGLIQNHANQSRLLVSLIEQRGTGRSKDAES